MGFGAGPSWEWGLLGVESAWTWGRGLDGVGPLGVVCGWGWGLARGIGSWGPCPDAWVPHREMVECFAHLAQDSACRAIVLSGAGKLFTAGNGARSCVELGGRA